MDNINNIPGLSDFFNGCTCLTYIPVGWSTGNNVVESTYPNTLLIDFIEKSYFPKGYISEKHRCPNCGATKRIKDDCEYCGT